MLQLSYMFIIVFVKIPKIVSIVFQINITFTTKAMNSCMVKIV